MTSVTFLRPIQIYANSIKGAATNGLSDLSQRVYNAVLSVLNSIDSFFSRCQNATVEYIRGVLSCFTARFVLYSLNELTKDENPIRTDEKLLSLHTASRVRFQLPCGES